MMNAIYKSWLLLFILSITLVACERIPEWERQQKSGQPSTDWQRLNELRKWIWTCRANLGAHVEYGEPRWLGKNIEEYLEYFRTHGLTTLQTESDKSLLGMAFLYSEAGYLVAQSGWLSDTYGIECNNGVSGWIPAKLRGQDRGLDLAVLKIDLPAHLGFRASNHWVPRQDAAAFDESFYALASVFPGQVDRLQVSIQPFGSSMHTGLDEDLILFLPIPQRVSVGGILVDRQWRVYGYMLPHRNALWGTAIRMSRLEESVSAIIESGKVLRPFSGFQLQYVTGDGFRVQQIEIGSPGYQSGLRVHDILLKWDGRTLKSLSDWNELEVGDIGHRITLVYKRGEKTVETQLVVGSAE